MTGAQSPSLPEFLLARLAEDADWARLADEAFPSPWWQNSGIPKDRVISGGKSAAHAGAPNIARFIARHDPARVLADVEAKRAVVRTLVNAQNSFVAISSYLSEGERRSRVEALADACRLLAQPYASHPDFDPGWAL